MSDLNREFDRPKELADSLLSLPYHIGGLVCGVALFFLYVLFSRWSYQFVLPPSPNAVFWLPSGLTVFLMIYFRQTLRLWPFFMAGLFVGEYFVVQENEIPFMPAIFWAAANSTLALTMGILSRRTLGKTFSFSRLKDVFSFAALVPIAVVPGAILAAVGSMIAFDSHFLSTFLSWALSDSLGIILVAPPLLAWTSPRNPIPADSKEALLLGGSLAFFTLCLFYYPGDKVIDRSFFSFLIFFAAWAAIRFGSRGVTLVLIVIDLCEVWMTGKGAGMFSNEDLSHAERLFTLQLFVVNLGVLMLILAAAIEEQMALREKAESAIRIRDDFISVASHELKTPLTSLTMEIQILNNYINSGKIRTVDDDRLKRLGRISEQEIKRFSKLINDLLDVSRITSGRIVFHREELDLLTLVNEAVDRLHSDIEKSGSIVTVTGQKDLLGLWDKVRIEQVITNLLSNAIKYGCGKPVLIRVEEVKGQAVMEIQDQGLGISSEDQHRIFQRFERAVSAKEYSGLGLGLFIAHQIAESHGGKITVESEVGQGSLFKFELPLLVSEGKTHPYWSSHEESPGRIYH